MGVMLGLYGISRENGKENGNFYCCCLCHHCYHDCYGSGVLDGISFSGGRGFVAQLCAAIQDVGALTALRCESCCTVFFCDHAAFWRCL